MQLSNQYHLFSLFSLSKVTSIEQTLITHATATLSGLSGGRRGPDQRAARDEGHRAGREPEAADRRRHGDKDQRGARGVPAGGHQRERAVLPHVRDGHGEQHVPDVAKAVPRTLRPLHGQVSVTVGLMQHFVIHINNMSLQLVIYIYVYICRLGPGCQ